MSKNEELMKDFEAYCQAHPEERFWQALTNWSGYPFIFITDPVTGSMKDCFYREGK